jgi:hypothetical protein
MCISCDLDRPVLYLLCLSTGFVETIKLLVRTAYNNDTHHNTNIVSLYLSAKTVPYKNDSVDCQKEIAKRKAPGLQSNALPLSYKCFIVAPNVSRTRDHSKSTFGGTGDRTRDFPHAKRTRYHCAIPPSYFDRI